MGDGVFVLDDRLVNYSELQAEAALEAAATLNAGGSPMQMMTSSQSSYAYGNPVFLTNLVVTTGPMTASFDIVGGTNNVPWDIVMATNLLTPASSWNWLGIGYTSNRYSFTSQPADKAFYRLAKPARTMIVGWGQNADYQTEIPAGITNAVMVAGGFLQGLALLADGTLRSWGGDYAYTSRPTNITGVAMIAGGWNHNLALQTNGVVTVWGNNSYGELDMPFPITNGVVISGQAYNSLVLLSNGTLVAWGDNSSGQTNVPASLTNVIAIACGGEHNLAVRADGTVAAWGNNVSGQRDVPAGLSNVWDVAAGWAHSAALKKDGTVVCWGYNGYGESSVPAGLSNVVMIAAGGSPNTGYTLAVKKDGTVVLWGKKTVNTSLGGLNQVITAGGGYDYVFAIRTGPPTPVVTLEPVDQYQLAGGSVSFTATGQGLYGVTYQWQTNGVNLAGATNPTLTLTNVQAAQQGSYRVIVNDHAGYGSIASSNASFTLLTPPVITYQSTPTNLVCIYGNHLIFNATASAPGMLNGFPLFYQWQFNGTNIAYANANNYGFSVNDNSSGNYTLIVSNAAGGATASWQVTVTNVINVTNDLLLIYNTNSADSTAVLNYYLAHRPNVGGANMLGIGYTNPFSPDYFETVTPDNLTNQILNPVSAWLTNNPAKRPQYVILFLDLPDRACVTSVIPTNGNYITGIGSSVSVVFQTIASDWRPYVTHLNMGQTNSVNRTNDCIAYINKLAAIGVLIFSNSPVLSASAGSYGNTNFVVDNVRFGITNSGENFGGFPVVSNATNSLLAAGVSPSAILFYDAILTTNNANNLLAHATNATNVAGYVSWGVHGGISALATIDSTITWHGHSGWYLINTIESLNGWQFTDLLHGHSAFTLWYSGTAYGGTNYSNTPVGAVATVDEPGGASLKNDSSVYFGLWARGKNFGICAWESKRSNRFIAIGDPLVAQ